MPSKDERTLLKISILGADAADESSYEVSLMNAESKREFRMELSQLHPAYFQLCLL